MQEYEIKQQTIDFVTEFGINTADGKRQSEDSVSCHKM